MLSGAVPSVVVAVSMIAISQAHAVTVVSSVEGSLSPTQETCFQGLTTSVGDGESAQWKTALGNEPDYLTTTSATRFIERDDDVPDTIGVVRGGADRRAIEQAYLDKVASTGARAVTIDAAGLSHEDVNTRIGAPGDTVMTPPLVAFLSDCLGPAPKPTNR